MASRLTSSAFVAVVAAGFFLCASTPLGAQWFKYPTADVPSGADGKPGLTAPTPRTREGKPDFSGMWLTGDGRPCPPRGDEFRVCGPELPMSRYGINIGAGTPGGLPYRPWAAQQVKTQIEQHAKDGYAVTQHRFTKPGHYLVRVERTNERGQKAIGHLHVPVEVEGTDATKP